METMHPLVFNASKLPIFVLIEIYYVKLLIKIMVPQ